MDNGGLGETPGENPADHGDGTRASISTDAERKAVFAHLVHPLTYPD